MKKVWLLVQESDNGVDVDVYSDEGKAKLAYVQLVHEDEEYVSSKDRKKIGKHMKDQKLPIDDLYSIANEIYNKRNEGVCDYWFSVQETNIID